MKRGRKYFRVLQPQSKYVLSCKPRQVFYDLCVISDLCATGANQEKARKKDIYVIELSTKKWASL